MHRYECVAPNVDTHRCRVDDSEPYQWLHTERASWISGPGENSSTMLYQGVPVISPVVQ